MGPSLALAFTSEGNPMIDETTRRLIEARRSGQPSVAAGAGPADAKAAYAVQNAVAHAFGWFDAGQRATGSPAALGGRPLSRTRRCPRKVSGPVRSRQQDGHFICVALKPKSHCTCNATWIRRWR